MPSKSSQSNKESPKEPQEQSPGATFPQLPTASLQHQAHSPAKQSQSKARQAEDAASDQQQIQHTN